ncbi:MAG: M28 family peptidase [Candidatus Marinimicrobia bacterium]|nr:M28 family peptidase [Candidatus Neomarinimicrobiota bacterium]MCF7828110.1 M28 family peptidase [Candidatus Neomarinimicrobiota bacterium]MCF7879715.1 M28 family peptidase [Candidatus Neomarinimicrobiota bacterium]
MSQRSESISQENLISHIKTLASDEFEGRAPSSPGEEKTVNYLREKFQSLGLQPGNYKSYFQEVPLVKFDTDYDDSMEITGRNQSFHLQFKKEMVASTRRMVDTISLKDSELVFAGYGIVAPEYEWNDYEGLDVEGKTVIVLVNDPGYATEDDSLFNGKAMTYYGRWTYKFEEASRQGAAGVLIVHETGPAGYPWEVVENSFGGPQFLMESEDGNMSRTEIEGWISVDAATKLFSKADMDLETMKDWALQPDFSAIPLDLSLTYSLHNSIEKSASRNVLAKLPGASRPDEFIIYTAHWDHFGVDGEGKIYNGARDNATGLAAMIEIARQFSQQPDPPDRSILFLPVTAEERGLLGSKYYAAHPVIPPENTVAVINMDALNIWGPTRDVTVIGYGNSELDDLVEEVAEEQGRYVRPDPEPEKGRFYRMDHFSFAKKGIPALATEHGAEHADHGEEWMLEAIDSWTEQHYHKPSDVYNEDTWDLAGAVQDTQMYFQIGYQLSQSNEFPNWKEGTEFRAIRDEMMERKNSET